ncbi:MAG: citrate/2-methylcitrate synthase [SAR202 cluster bacterium]|jgi:citrate synthase|nr:citrate/2-methylcitrate synthase [SAR202 cluster bacterium]
MAVVKENIELNKGLKNGYFDRTTSSLIVAKPGKLLYRGYNIDDLARFSTFEETTYLLLHGTLPTHSKLDELDATLKANRELPQEVQDIIRIYRNAHPMDVLRGAVSAMSLSDPDILDVSPQGALKKGIRLTSAVATMVAFHHRVRHGLEPIKPDPELTHAGNFLYMLFGERPDADDTSLMDTDLILHAEHGANASAFAARVAASTGADFWAAITAAVAVLKGPKHGGAAEGAIRMAQEVGSEENAEVYVENIIANRGRVMGFGHPVYDDVDPRSVHLKAEAKALGERRGHTKWFSIIEAVTNTEAMKKRAKRGIAPNVDLWSGAIYSLLGIPDDLFVPLFAVGRMPGWTLHVFEQYSVRDILRPRLLYAGPVDLEYSPIDQRD